MVTVEFRSFFWLDFICKKPAAIMATLAQMIAQLEKDPYAQSLGESTAAMDVAEEALVRVAKVAKGGRGKSRKASQLEPPPATTVAAPSATIVAPPAVKKAKKPKAPTVVAPPATTDVAPPATPVSQPATTIASPPATPVSQPATPIASPPTTPAPPPATPVESPPATPIASPPASPSAAPPATPVESPTAASAAPPATPVESPTSASLPATSAAPPTTPVIKQEPFVAVVKETTTVAIKDARRAARMAFKRTLDPGQGKRSLRQEKIPGHIADKIKAKPSLENDYFEAWLKSKCSWGLVELSERIVQGEKNAKTDVSQWMTEAQLDAHFVLPEISKAVMAEKTANPATWRPHPDAPECRAARQYLVEISSQVSQELTWCKTRATELMAEIDAEAAESLLPGRIAKPSWMRTLGIFPTTNVASAGGESGSSDREKAEKEEKAAAEKAEKDLARRQRLEEIKADKEKEKSTPVGMAKALLVDIHKESRILKEQTALCSVKDSKVPASVLVEYAATFAEIHRKLKASEKKIEAIIASSTDNPCHRKKATEELESSADTRSKFKKLSRVYTR